MAETNTSVVDSIAPLQNSFNKIDTDKNETLDYSELMNATNTQLTDIKNNLRAIINDKIKINWGLSEKERIHLKKLILNIKTAKEACKLSKTQEFQIARAKLDNLEEILEINKEAEIKLDKLEKEISREKGQNEPGARESDSAKKERMINDSEYNKALEKNLRVLKLGNLDYNDLNLKSALSVLINSWAIWDSKKDWEHVWYKHGGIHFSDGELKDINVIKDRFKNDSAFKGVVVKLMKCEDGAGMDSYMKSLGLVKTESESKTAASQVDWVAKNLNVESRAEKTKENPNKDLEEIFWNFLNLEDKNFDEINIESFVKNFGKIKWNMIEDWMTNWYEPKNTWWLRGKEEKQINKILQKCSTDKEFKTKLDLIQRVVNSNGNLKTWLESHWYTLRQDENVKFNNKWSLDLSSTDKWLTNFITFLSDVDWDWVSKVRNKQKEWFFLNIYKFFGWDPWMTQSEIMWEAMLRDKLIENFSSFESLKWLTSKLWLTFPDLATAKPDDLKKFRVDFWKALTKTLKAQWVNWQAAWIDAFLKGKEKTFAEKVTNFELEIEKALNEKDKNLDAKATEIENKLWIKIDRSELKKNLLEEVKWWQFSIFWWAISWKEWAKYRPMFDNIINAISAQNYKWILWFTISKEIFSDWKWWTVTAWLANFIPFVAAHEDFTVVNRNKIWDDAELKSNAVISPFISLSPLTIWVWVDIWVSKIATINKQKTEFRDDVLGKIVLEKWELKFNDLSGLKDSKEIDQIKEINKTIQKYYDARKIDNKDPNSQEKNKILLDNIKIWCLSYYIDSLYSANTWVSFSGLMLGAVATWDFDPFKFIWINFESISTEISERGIKDATALNSLEQQATLESTTLSKLWFTKWTVTKWRTEFTVYKYNKKADIFAPKDVQIEEINGETCISWNVESIKKINITDNVTKGKFYISINWAETKISNPTISSSLIEKTVQSKEAPRDIEIPTEKFELDLNSDVSKRMNNVSSIEIRQKATGFGKLQDLYLECALAWDGDFTEAWDQLKNIRVERAEIKWKWKHMVWKHIFADITATTPQEKMQILWEIVWKTAWDWRIRLFNKIKTDPKLFKEFQTKTKFKWTQESLTIWDVKDAYSSDKINAAYDSHVLSLVKEWYPIDKVDEDMIKDELNDARNRFETINKMNGKKEKMPSEKMTNIIAFVNFAQMAVDKKWVEHKKFQWIAPITWNIDLVWKPVPITDQNSYLKETFVDMIPEFVLKSYLKDLNAKSPKYKLETTQQVKDILNGKTVNHITWSFDLLYSRWGECMNDTYLISWAKFKIPGIPEFTLVTPVALESTTTVLWKQENDQDKYTLGWGFLNGRWGKWSSKSSSTGIEDVKNGGDGWKDSGWASFKK